MKVTLTVHQYRRIQEHAHRLRNAAARMNRAATIGNDSILFLAYCDVIFNTEKIRDAYAGREEPSNDHDDTTAEHS